MSDAAWPGILRDPEQAATYRAVLAAAGRLGPHDVRFRKAAVQLVRPDGAGFAAMSPGSDGLMMTLVVDAPVASARMQHSQEVSPGVWNQRLTLTSADALDDEVRGWLATAYRRPVTG